MQSISQIPPPQIPYFAKTHSNYWAASVSESISLKKITIFEAGLCFCADWR